MWVVGRCSERRSGAGAVVRRPGMEGGREGENACQMTGRLRLPCFWPQTLWRRRGRPGRARMPALPRVRTPGQRAACTVLHDAASALHACTRHALHPEVKHAAWDPSHPHRRAMTAVVAEPSHRSARSSVGVAGQPRIAAAGYSRSPAPAPPQRAQRALWCCCLCACGGRRSCARRRRRLLPSTCRRRRFRSATPRARSPAPR